VPAQQRILIQKMTGAGWRVPEVLAVMPAAADSYFEVIGQVPVERWLRGRGRPGPRRRLQRLPDHRPRHQHVAGWRVRPRRRAGVHPGRPTRPRLAAHHDGARARYRSAGLPRARGRRDRARHRAHHRPESRCCAGHPPRRCSQNGACGPAEPSATPTRQHCRRQARLPGALRLPIVGRYRRPDFACRVQCLRGVRAPDSTWTAEGTRYPRPVSRSE
jgi:hypothetical protein